MIDGRYHETRVVKGTTFLIDLAMLPNGEYEAMVLTVPKGTEYACKRSWNFDEALAAYNKMLKEYTEEPKKPLTGKYAKLRDDLKIALKAGKDAEAKSPEDGGTCNFDSAAISLPRWNKELVKQAAEEAGTRAWEWNLWGSRRWVFSPDTHAQANARSRNAESMVEALTALGYDATDYCQAD